MPVVPVAHCCGAVLAAPQIPALPRAPIHAASLKPIEAGSPRTEFHARLVAETEAATDQLLIEAATGPNPPPLPETARRRLAELGVSLPKQAVAAQ